MEREVAPKVESNHVPLKISEFIKQVYKEGKSLRDEVSKVIEAALENTPSRERVLNIIVYLGYLVEHLTLIEGEDSSATEVLCTDVADILVLLRGGWIIRQGGWEKGIKEMQTWGTEKMREIYVEHGWTDILRQMRWGKRRKLTAT